MIAANLNNSNGFYPVPFCVIKDDRGFKLHLDLGDYSSESKRSLRFNDSTVFSRGQISCAEQYGSLVSKISEANRTGELKL